MQPALFKSYTGNSGIYLKCLGIWDSHHPLYSGLFSKLLRLHLIASTTQICLFTIVKHPSLALNLTLPSAYLNIFIFFFFFTTRRFLLCFLQPLYKWFCSDTNLFGEFFWDICLWGFSDRLMITSYAKRSVSYVSFKICGTLEMSWAWCIASTHSKPWRRHRWAFFVVVTKS